MNSKLENITEVEKEKNKKDSLHLISEAISKTLQFNAVDKTHRSHRHFQVFVKICHSFPEAKETLLPRVINTLSHRNL